MTARRKPPAAGRPCDHCGAPLPSADASGTFTCTYCNTAYAAPAPRRPTARRSGPARPAARRTPAPLAAVGAAVVAIAVVGALAVARSGSGGSEGRVREVVRRIELTTPTRPPIATVPRPASRYPTAGTTVLEVPDSESVVFAVNRRLELSGQTLVRVGGRGITEWESAPFAHDDFRRPIAISGDSVFAADGPNVVALDVRTGARQWSTPLTDIVRGSCDDDCFGPFAGSELLVVRTIDGQVSALERTTGREVWTRRLTYQYATLHRAGGHLLVIDQAPDEKGYELVELDPATGQDRRRLRPACDAEPARRSAFPGITPAASVVALGSDAVLVQLTIGERCWQRYDLATGTRAWTSEGPPASPADAVTVARPGAGADVVALASGSTLGVLDLASGSWRPLHEDPDLDLSALYVDADVAVALGTRNRGTKTFLVRAFDVSTGALRWSRDLGSGELIDAQRATTVLADREVVGVGAAGGSVVVARVAGGTAELAVERLAAASGAPSPLATITAGGFRSAWSAGWPLTTARRLIFLAGDSVVEIDAVTGATGWRWDGAGPP